MIYLTGDKHIPIDIKPMQNENFPEGKKLSRRDYVIVTGDFGALWDGSNQDTYWLNWLEKKPYSILFVDGNHENFSLLNNFPIETWEGGKIHRLRPNVLHLMRGQIFTLEGKKFFTFGGAESIDKYRREQYVDWWAEEMPSYAEYEEGLKNLEHYGNQVDYIITHDCSVQTLLSFAKMFPSFYPKTNNLNAFFETLEESILYKHWYFGHYHHDINIDKKHTLLFKDIILLM